MKHHDSKTKPEVSFSSIDIVSFDMPQLTAEVDALGPLRCNTRRLWRLRYGSPLLLYRLRTMRLDP